MAEGKRPHLSTAYLSIEKSSLYEGDINQCSIYLNLNRDLFDPFAVTAPQKVNWIR